MLSRWGKKNAIKIMASRFSLLLTKPHTTWILATL